MSAMNPASFAHPAGSGVPSSNALAPLGEAPNDGLHPQYGGQAQAYPAYATAGGGMMAAQRASAQQSALPQQAMAGFPPRHSPTATEFIPQSGYGPAYLNGSQPHAFAPGDGHGPNGSDWMGLQGLSLNSH